MAKGPNATPLVTGGRVFTLGATGILTAWDAASGKKLWEQNYTKQVDFSKLFCGTAASPILAHGLVVVQVGSDIHGGRILALDPATGTAKWEWKGRRTRLRVARADHRGRDVAARDDDQPVNPGSRRAQRAASCGRCRSRTNGTRTS